MIAPLAVRAPLIGAAGLIASAIAKVRLPHDIDETTYGVQPDQTTEAGMAE